ncbi:hypothetical protein B0T18DRAFT_422979 [Schizothecium vesticola]|uniref:Riboflavin kinase n=1 Tax=Schizothecium vesticola TaxID=314040 RepID=A0AA40BR19_9PEZI|nr:hypothetical protein B0T18DRAFT_422979 [Schizothecium vesticola]
MNFPPPPTPSPRVPIDTDASYFPPPPPPYTEFDQNPGPPPPGPPLGPLLPRPSSRNEAGSSSPWLQAPRLRVQTSMPNLAGRSHHAQSPSPFSPTPPPSANTWGAKSSTPRFGAGTLITPPTSAPIPTPTPTLATTDDKTFWQTALSEAGHFAGGLLPHPTESTKHYTILRHSAALVFYRGPSTSVEISIFSAPKYPLPPDRTLWLQQRGYSGDSGMKLKAMVGGTTDWLNVTPAAQIRADDVPASDNRAWQRDISKASKRLVKDRGEVKAHVPRETHAIRIPSMSADGYFRLALCTGGGDDHASLSRRKVLCLSPIFRVASTSTDSSVFRGASLSTMPIEVGVKVASLAAHVAVKRYTGPVVGLVQSRIDKIRPGLTVREMSKSAITSLTPKSSPNATHHAPTTQNNTFSHSNALLPLGHPSGPDPPFPIQFSGTVAPGSGRSQLDLGIPTANLASLSPSDTTSRLRGVYFGWACLAHPRHPQTTWYQAVIASGPSPYARPSVVPVLGVSVHLLHEFPAQGFVGAQVTVLVMGFLRPMLGEGGEAGTVPLRVRLDAVSRDVLLTVASLTNREGWTAERGVEGVATRKEERGVRERVVGEVQRRVEGVPVHWLGVRTEGEAERERSGERGKGGWWVAW